MEKQLHIVSNNIHARIRKYVSHSVTGVSVNNELILLLIYTGIYICSAVPYGWLVRATAWL